MTAPVNSSALIVLGVHRSGTSALAGALAELGFHPGSSLLPAVQGVNNNGFFEDQRVVELNDRTLQMLGRNWRWPTPLPNGWMEHPELAEIRGEIRNIVAEQENHGAWLLKDPRLCQLLPLWLTELRAIGVTPSILMTHRDLREVRQSLHARDQIAEPLAESLWLDHLLTAERESRELPRILVHYRQLLDQPLETLKGVCEWLAIEPDEELLGRAAATISPNEAHHQAHRLQAPSLAIAQQLNEALTGLIDTPNALAALQQKEIVRTFENIAASHRENLQFAGPMLDAQAADITTKEQSLAEAFVQIDTNQQATKAYAANAALSADAARQHHRNLTQALSKIDQQETVLAQEKIGHQQFRERAKRVLGDMVLPPAQSSSREQTTNDYKGLINLQVENNSHTRVIRYLREYFQTDATQKVRVLEIGCSEGYFGAALKADGHEVWGIETNSVAADSAEAVLDRVYRDSIEAFLLTEDFIDERFDAIIFGDVLEHLLDPRRVLQAVTDRLTDRGVIIASVPNVAHERVRMMLLEGRWEYSATGIMDNTHLHFFTRDTLIELFTKTGLCVQRFSAITLDGNAVQIPVDAKTISIAEEIITDRERDVFQFIALVRPAAAVGAEVSAKVSAEVSNAPFLLAKQQNILCLPPAPQSSLYSIRLGDPLERYCQLFGGEVRIAPFGAPTQEDIEWADTIVLQREVTDQQLDMVEQLQESGKRVVFDIDDYLLDAPEYLSVHEHCKAMRPKLEIMLNRVDAVSVSTQPLQEKLRAFNPRVFLTPNYAWTSQEPIAHDRPATDHPVRIIVASSDSVRVDFLIDALRELASTENIELIGIGPPGDELREAGLPVDTAPLMPHEQFKAYAASRDNTIALIPLDANEFNSCKSAIKYFDYALAGVPCVCSGVEPYTSAVQGNVTGILCPAETAEWVSSVRNLLHNVELRRQIAWAARKQVLDRNNLNLTAAAWNRLFAGSRFKNDDPLYQEPSVETEECPTKPSTQPTTKANMLRFGLRQALRRRTWATAWGIYKNEGFTGLREKLKLVF